MRCQVMERCWFVGKRCLDVGCNAGLVSLAVATRFGTAAMLGLDIDADLIRQASVNLSRCLINVSHRQFVHGSMSSSGQSTYIFAESFVSHPIILIG